MIAERMEYLSTRLTAAQHRDYESVKEVVLEELKLSPAEYKGRFLGARKRKTETWKSFATRLRSFLNCYVSSRDVQTYEELVELLVVDQLKTGLSGEALKYVTLREGTTWLRSSELARLLQTFDDAAGNMRTPEVQLSGAKPKAPPRPFSGYANRGTEWGGNPNTRPKQPHSGGRESKPRTCFECGSQGHIRINCPRLRERRPQNTVNANRDDRLTARVATGCYNEGESRLLNATLRCKGKEIAAIVDSGAEITVVRESVVPDELVQSHGKIRLRSAFGEEVEAKLAVLPLAVRQGRPSFACVAEQTPLLCALTDKLNSRTDCLISAEDWGILQEQNDCDEGPIIERNAPVMVPELVGTVETDEQAIIPEKLENAKSRQETAAASEGVDFNAIEDGSIAMSDSESFKKEQEGDETLKKAWQDAKGGKAGMLIVDGFLFHQDRILGLPVKQLVLPKGRRAQVLKLAHESYWGGHLGFRKTNARVKLSFFWPGMEREIREHCNSCHGCQVRANRKQTDRDS
ncbi:uncharacterized protein LOC119444676 [Dermacentor silvarum]|uniref:uncharacterized protein LOC119444676 n=1 Tax=Dermacentor silvarum TaxID=543639 RepID=UPI002100F9E8|nr:uncharacterized protein LOC119444676 [Dermacentor silvarum]